MFDPEPRRQLACATKAGISVRWPGNDPQEPTAIRFVLTRARYEELAAATLAGPVDQPWPESPSAT